MKRSDENRIDTQMIANARVHKQQKSKPNFMAEIRKFRTEITIETLSVTTIKKRENVAATANCRNCGGNIPPLHDHETAFTDEQDISETADGINHGKRN
jgi:transcription elongation factor Elf1